LPKKIRNKIKQKNNLTLPPKVEKDRVSEKMKKNKRKCVPFQPTMPHYMPSKISDNDFLANR
jgi:hypothetical protein